jgi:hypothetical protein
VIGDAAVRRQVAAGDRFDGIQRFIAKHTGSQGSRFKGSKVLGSRFSVLGSRFLVLGSWFLVLVPSNRESLNLEHLNLEP